MALIVLVKPAALPIALIVITYLGFQSYGDGQAEKHKQIKVEKAKKRE
jgi:hypothetical protein